MDALKCLSSPVQPPFMALDLETVDDEILGTLMTSPIKLLVFGGLLSIRYLVGID